MYYSASDVCSWKGASPFNPNLINLIKILAQVHAFSRRTHFVILKNRLLRDEFLNFAFKNKTQNIILRICLYVIIIKFINLNLCHYSSSRHHTQYIKINVTDSHHTVHTHKKTLSKIHCSCFTINENLQRHGQKQKLTESILS